MKRFLIAIGLLLFSATAVAQVNIKTYNSPTDLLGFYGKVQDYVYTNNTKDSVDVALGDADSIYVMVVAPDTFNVKTMFRRIPYQGAPIASMVHEVKADSTAGTAGTFILLHRGITVDQRGFYGYRIVTYHSASANAVAPNKRMKTFVRVVRVF